ncbi:MAG: group 1 truncated hemoglobin [Thermodesulfobacteriota bacterium]|jgi:hemoglobin
MTEATLYERLGGEEKILAVVTDIVALHHQNPTIKTRFDNAKKSDLELIDLVVDLVCSGTGGPQEYKGMSMRDTHKGMNISDAEFVAVLDDILEAMAKHGIGEREKAEVLAIAYSMKGEIVHV